MSVKAFELVSCIDRIQPPIECVECCGKNIYIGAADSFILQYLIEERILPNGSVQFQCTRQRQKYLGFKKPISLIKCASALNRLLVLCDGTLFILSMFDLEPVPSGPKIKGVINFCINQDPSSNNPFSLEICVARRRNLQVYHITEDKAIYVRDVPLPEAPSTGMAMDGKHVCLALSNKYAIVDCEASLVQDVLPYDNEATVPLTIRINKGEFLLNGPSALGIFVTTARTSERPPLPWSESVRFVAFIHPYVIALDLEYLIIYSILDQKQKQRMQFHHGCYLDNFDGKIFAATTTSIYALIPIPWDKQVRALLADRKVTEALELAKYCNWPGLSKDLFLKTYRKIQREAGFIELAESNYDHARELFISGQLDPRELIELYPGLLPSTSNFVKSIPPLHSIANMTQMCQGDENRFQNCRTFLIRYLEDAREMKNNIKCQKDVDVALLKLYAEVNSAELTSMIVAANPEGHEDECANTLERFRRYNALALFYNHHGHYEKALDVWIKLIEGTYSDETFQGLPFVVEFLANLKDYALVWRYANFVLEKDPEIGVKIFTERPYEQETEVVSVKPDAVVEYLQQFPSALLKYLEHLIFQRHVKNEKFHTHLAIIYFENVIKFINDSPTDDDVQLLTARQKLQHMLKSSSNYRVKYLLNRTQNTNLYLETAILHGKLEEHDKGLRLLVHQLNDPQAARDYCQHYANGRDLVYKQQLFHTLLGVYLDPALDQTRREELFEPAISLLNSELAEFDAALVLKILPDQWSASIVDHFLRRAVRRSASTRRTTQIAKSLAKVENIQLRLTQYFVQRNPIVVSESRPCAICGRTFDDSAFSCYPSGDVVHLHCSRSTEEKLSDKPTSNAVNETPSMLNCDLQKSVYARR